MRESKTTQLLSEHEIHDVLRNERRARTLKHLKRERRTVPLRELAEALATAETGKTPPPRNVRESVYNSLHQTHLPKLDDLGVVAYERDRKTVALREGARQVDLYMEVVPEHGVTWAAYYRALGVLSLAVVGLAAAGVPAFAAVGPLAFVAASLALFALSTFYHLRERDGFFFGQMR